MTNFLKNNIFTTIMAVTVLMSSLLTGCGSSAEPTRTVEEKFEITEISEDKKEIRGEKTEGTGEGIYLDKTYYHDFEKLDLTVGDVITVVYDKADYEDEIWDNIIEVKE